MAESVVSLDSPDNRVYRVLSFPREVDFEGRLRELRALGVEHMIFEGPTELEGFRVLGKGCTSVVVKAKGVWGYVAVKIRRTDSDREDMFHEAFCTVLANSVGVGPKVFAFSPNFLVLELLEGTPIGDWIREAPADLLIRVVDSLMRKAFALDAIGLDHGELSRAQRHVLISDSRPRILDFESASVRRKPKNLTSIVQYVMRSTDKSLDGETISLLREYKKSPSLENYAKVRQRVIDILRRG